MIDLHCHILPGIDDGPANEVESLALARAAVTAGATNVVATPHVSGRYQHNTSLRIAMAVLSFNQRLEEDEIPLQVVKGSEVELARAGDLGDDELGRLRLGSGPWLLTECPISATSDEFEFHLLSLAERGFRVLLAHPERITAFRKDPGLLGELVERGMLCQLTASSLAGRFGKEIQSFSWTLVDEGRVHVVASDAHGADRRRPNVLGHLREQSCPEDWIAWWTRGVPAALLAGDDLPPRPSGPVRAPRPRSRFRRA